MNVDRALTAMCLWEAWLEIRSSSQAEGDPAAMEMERLQVDHGTWTCREMVLGLAEDCDTAWAAAHAMGYDEDFDWEFCPDFLRGVVAGGTLEERTIASWQRHVQTRQMVAGDIGL